MQFLIIFRGPRILCIIKPTRNVFHTIDFLLQYSPLVREKAGWTTLTYFILWPLQMLGCGSYGSFNMPHLDSQRPELTDCSCFADSYKSTIKHRSVDAVCWHLVNLDAFGTFHIFRDIRPAARLLQGRLRSRAASTTWRPVMWSSWVRAQLRPPWWNLLPLCPHRWHNCNPFTKCGVLSLTCSVQRPMLGITIC